MKKLQSFYDDLYFIAFKTLLIDNENWVKLNNQYSIKVSLLSGINEPIPELAIKIVNNQSSDLYEHCIRVSKVTEIYNRKPLPVMIKDWSILERVKYIVSVDLTITGKPYHMTYLPIHLKPVSEELMEMARKCCRKCNGDLAEALKLNKKQEKNKITK